jgi:molecular chaperone GrpE
VKATMMTKAKTKPPVDGAAPAATPNSVVTELQQQLEQALAMAHQATENERRAKADYQNLVRRNQEERGQLVKFATKALASDLLQPLDHLSLAAAQLNDPGLNMVIGQFWQVLNDHGLTVIDPVGQPFDLATMEAVDNGEKKAAAKSDEELRVTKVVTKGYKLNGEVIQFARVILG